MLLPLLLWSSTALATPLVTIDARVDPDLQVVRGTMTIEGLDGAPLEDPLATLPIPSLEVARIRTWPGKPERGGVVWQREGDVIVFEAHLPRRWGDTGSTRYGLFANGSWYPQPIVDGVPPIVRWDVDVALPGDTAAALGDVVGERALHWEGVADRASLAVVPDGVVRVVDGDGYRVRVLTRHEPRRGLVVSLSRQLPLTAISGRDWDGVAVEAPLRRRLSRPGADLGYVSDRAFKVTPVFRHLHTAGALSGLLASWTGAPDPYTRELTAAALRRLLDDRVEKQAEADLVKLTKWLPIIDAALYSWEMDYRSELFDETVPTDRVDDDLDERYRPHTPGSQVIAQVEDRFGRDVADALASGLAVGWTLPEAEARLGIPTGWFERFHAIDPPPEDDRLAVHRSTVTVSRQVREGAAEETIVVAADAQRLAWNAPGGPSAATWFLDAHPRTTILDPDKHLDQTSAAGDQKPAKIRWTLWGRVWNLGVPTRYASIMGALTLRRRNDTHNAFRIWAWTTQRYFFGGRLSWTHYEGRQVRPTIREHAFTIGAESGWLDPSFGSSPGADYTVGGTLQYQWDNRRSTIFPRDGASVTASVQAGGAPQTGQEYVRLQASFLGDKSLHPRHVLAARAIAGVAWSEIPQERLDFGGSDGLRGVPDQQVPTDVQGILSLEYRALVAQDAWWSLAGLAWVRDLYVIAGLDVGIGIANGQQIGAVGVATGLGATLELGGISPGSLNLVVAWPAWWDGFDLRARTNGLPIRFYATWGVSF